MYSEAILWFRMLYIFSILIIIMFLLFHYWVEGQIFLYRVAVMSIRRDDYSLSFFTLLGIVSFCVGVWSYYYIDCELTHNRFLSLLFAFVFRMVMLIFFSNLFITLIGWDGLGVTSFLLIIYYKNRQSLGSGMITALSNRVGDCLLLCLLGFYLISSSATVLFLTICLRITKRAQFPFSAWLPAAIAAPTPVSALVHSSTLVTAGVYVLIRFCHTETNRLLFIGRWTMITAGFSACAIRDLKKVVALRTLSQLGVIIISLGSDEKSYCFFHLISHATFKALLFLCVGVCIHSEYGTQDYRRFNNLSPALVSIFATVANISLMGFVFTTGFYSKDHILESLTKEENSAWLICLFLIGVGLTACYSAKILIYAMITNTFTTAPTLALGGYSWTIKIPLFLLGFRRLVLGSFVQSFRGALFIVLNQTEKLLPLIFLGVGYWLGTYRSLLIRPIFNRIYTLVPFTQMKAVYAVTIGVHQKTVDKGWLEAIALSYTFTTHAIIRHYTPILRIGIIVFLYIIHYG